MPGPEDALARRSVGCSTTAAAEHPDLDLGVEQDQVDRPLGRRPASSRPRR